MSMTRLMHGFPSEATGQVTLANWRSPPFNRWAFHHVRELIPKADIANDPRRAWNLDPGESELAHGQHLFDRGCGVVVAKLSSQAQPVDVALMQVTRQAIARGRATFAERTPCF